MLRFWFLPPGDIYSKEESRPEIAKDRRQIAELNKYIEVRGFRMLELQWLEHGTISFTASSNCVGGSRGPDSPIGPP